MSELDSLIKMANQIAANFSFHEDPVKPLANHLKRFWAPVMRKQLSDYAETDGKGLDKAVFAALRYLETNGKPPVTE